MINMEELMRTARENGASDVHITAGIPPRMRVNGFLISMEYQRLMPDEIERMLQNIMKEKQSQRLEEKGEADFSFSTPQAGRCRINVFKQSGSYAAVLHLIRETIPDVLELRVPQSAADLYRKKRGLILVTGPSGSGKTTTLAALLHKINQNVHAHIITLENPIEYLHQHDKAIVSQREIGQDTCSYVSALRAALREDSDVILIGEMCSPEIIDAAVTAAETGHLVFSALHTVGAANTIDYMINAFPPYQQQQMRIRLAGVLEAVVSQQLIPTSNHRERVPAFEVMHANLAAKNLIREGKTSQIGALIQSGRKQGMQTMDDALFELYIRGEIDREQALAYAQDVGMLERKLI